MTGKHRRIALKAMSIFLAVSLLIGTFTVGVFAGNDPYLDDAIKDKYNSIDQVELTDAQNAAILLDLADRELAKANMIVDIPLIGSLNMTSVDNLLSSIYSLTGNWLYGSATVGDLSVLETYRNDIATARRSNPATSDLQVLNSVLTYITHCAPTLVKILDNTFDWGMVMSFLPKDVQAMLNDLPKFVKKTLWDVCHPVMQLPDGTYSKPQPYNNESLDEIVQFIFDNQLGGQNKETTGLYGVLPGLDIDLIESSGYDVFEQFIFACLNEFAVPAINSSLKPIIKNAVESNMKKYPNCTLDEFIKVDFEVKKYDYKAGVSLEDQLNAILGSYVKQMLQENVFEWKTGTTYDVLEDNVNRLLIEIIQRGGDQKNVSDFNLKQTVTYVAHEAVQEFVKHIEMPDDLNLRQIAFIGLREFAATIIPEADYSAIDFNDPSVRDNNDAWLNIVADIGTFYMNNLIDFNYDPANTEDKYNATKFDKFMNALLVFGIRRSQGLLETSDFGANDTVWEKFDHILWDVFDENWIPKNVRAIDGPTSKNVVDYALDTILEVKVDNLFYFFAHQGGTDGLNKPAQDSLIEIVRNLIEQALPGTVPAEMKLDCFEDVLNPANLKVLLVNFATNLEANKDTVIPPALRLVVMILGAANEQSLGEVSMDIASRVDCTGGKVPAGQTVKVTNWSNGVNRGYRDAQGALHQDSTYRIKLVSAASSDSAITLGDVAGKVLKADASVDIPVSGDVTENKLVKFTLTYNILDEREGKTENDFINPVPLTKSVYVNLIKDFGLNGVMTPASADGHHTWIQEFPTYTFATNVYEASNFSVTMNHRYYVASGNNKEQTVTAVNVTEGTLPAGMAVNSDSELTKLGEVSISTKDTYGTLIPFRMEANTNDSQPYGIYPVTFNATVESTDGVVTTGAVQKIFVIYNDFGLPGLLNAAMGYNRQRSDYAENAQTEWDAYETAMKNAAALVYGNGVLSDMFATYADGKTGAIDDGEQKNAYGLAYEALENAIVALDEKVKDTNTKAIEDLEKLLKAQESPEGGYFDYVDYELYTFRRWQGWMIYAWDMVNSQKEKNAPALRALDIAYTKHMVDMTYVRMLRKVASTNYLNKAIDDAKKAQGTNEETYFAPDTWAPFKAALDFAEAVAKEPVGTPEAPQLRQSKVNAARLDLIKATNNLRVRYLNKVNSKVIIDSYRMFIYGLDLEMSADDYGDYFKEVAGYKFIPVANGPDGSAGTGTLVNVYEGETIVATYTILVYGDLNGDGAITEEDTAVMASYINGSAIPSSVYFTAADLSGDGVINDEDNTLLSKVLNDEVSIDQTTGSIVE